MKKYTLKKLVHGSMRRLARFTHYHPTSNPYLSGDTFRTTADHVHDMDSTVDPAAVRQNNIVFVQSPRLREFFTHVHPKITAPYILISHNGDENIDDSFSSYLDERIIHWFAQNCLITHPKITPLPIGLENKWYYLHGIPSYFTKLRKGAVQKTTAILYKFSVSTNPPERGAALAVLGTHPLAQTYTDWRESYAYLRTLQNVQFVASPAGNGEDCIRTWEAMYLRTVPILRRSVFATYFENLGLPLYIIEDWSELTELTPEKLAGIYATMSSKWDAQTLWADYWITQINSKKI